MWEREARLHLMWASEGPFITSLPLSLSRTTKVTSGDCKHKLAFLSVSDP